MGYWARRGGWELACADRRCGLGGHVREDSGRTTHDDRETPAFRGAVRYSRVRRTAVQQFVVSVGAAGGRE